MKGRCSLRSKSASPSPAVNVLKDKKKGRTYMVRKKWYDKAASLSPERGSRDKCGEGGISFLCKGHQREEVRRWGPRVDAGGPDLTVKVGGREEGSLLVLVTGLPFGLLPCKVRSVFASHLWLFTQDALLLHVEGD